MRIARVGSSSTLRATGWMYLGRAVGLVWTVLLIHRLGIGDYGRYGIAYAVCAIVGTTLDQPFAARAVREAEADYRRERSARILCGMALAAAALLLAPLGYVVWFGLTLAGAELIVAAYKSDALRHGRPSHVWRADTLRQAGSVSLAAGYLVLADAPDLERASALYLVPYLVVLLLTLRHLWSDRPQPPGSPRQMGVLGAEMLATCLYLQGDLVLLGHWSEASTVGYYSLTQTVFFAVIAATQAYAAGFIPRLRESRGAPAAGPPARGVLAISVATGLAMVLAAVVVLLADGPGELAAALAVMGIFAGARSVTTCLQALLIAQRRDLLRFATVTALIPAKILLLWFLVADVRLGAVGAATAASIVEVGLMFAFLGALARTRSPGSSAQANVRETR